MGWMAVMWWKLEPPRVRCRRKVLCFRRLAYGAEEQEGEWTGKRIPAQHTSFLSDESCVGKKKKNSRFASCWGYIPGRNMQISTPPRSWKLYFSNWLIDLRFPQSYRLWSSHPLYGSFCCFFSLMLYFFRGPNPPEVCCTFNLFEIHCFFVFIPIHHLKPQLIGNVIFLTFLKHFSLFMCSCPSCASVIIDSKSLASLSYFLGKWPAVKKNKTCWNGV